VNHEIVGRDAVCSALTGYISAWSKGTGNVVILSAESGMGKTAVLDWVEAQLATAHAGATVRVDCRPPIGAINTSAIQPLQPFGAAIDKLFLQSGQAARKRLALNIGMSVLASIPIAGDLFYAVKAISQDVNEYKRDTAATQEKKRSAVAECVATLQSIAEKTPFVLLVDEAHWSDAQSVEVVRQLLASISDIPLLIIWAVSPSVVQHSNLPLATLLRVDSLRSNTLHLEPIGRADVANVVHSVVPDVSVPENIVSILFERSAGNPGIIVEYIRYMQGAGHFRSDGTIDERAFDAVKLVTGDHPGTEMHLRDVSEDDAVLLSLCAAEGQEFTAFMQAALTNTDILTTIRTLRRLQNQTGLIRSIGMRTRYGVKTTAYEFSELFSYTFFMHRPEYEERKNIHQRIAEILSREFSTTQIDELRRVLVVDIAAHGAEAEDNSTVERMLLHSANDADIAGSTDIAAYIRSEILPQYSTDLTAILGPTEPTTEESGFGGSSHVPMTIVGPAIIRSLADAIVSGRSSEARTTSLRILETHGNISRHERVTVTCLAARACVDLGMIDEAELLMRTIVSLADITPSDQCLMKNVEGIIAMARGNSTDASVALHEAAQLAEHLPVHIRVLTLGNIMIHLRASEDNSSSRYEQTLRRLASVHGWPGVRQDLGL